jgi:hypothetical protein
MCFRKEDIVSLPYRKRYLSTGETVTSSKINLSKNIKLIKKVVDQLVETTDGIFYLWSQEPQGL